MSPIPGAAEAMVRPWDAYQVEVGTDTRSNGGRSR